MQQRPTIHQDSPCRHDNSPSMLLKPILFRQIHTFQIKAWRYAPRITLLEFAPSDVLVDAPQPEYPTNLPVIHIWSLPLYDHPTAGPDLPPVQAPLTAKGQPDFQDRSIARPIHHVYGLPVHS